MFRCLDNFFNLFPSELLLLIWFFLKLAQLKSKVFLVSLAVLDLALHNWRDLACWSSGFRSKVSVEINILYWSDVIVESGRRFLTTGLFKGQPTIFELYLFETNHRRYTLVSRLAVWELSVWLDCFFAFFEWAIWSIIYFSSRSFLLVHLLPDIKFYRKIFNNLNIIPFQRQLIFLSLFSQWSTFAINKFWLWTLFSCVSINSFITLRLLISFWWSLYHSHLLYSYVLVCNILD